MTWAEQVNRATTERKRWKKYATNSNLLLLRWQLHSCRGRLTLRREKKQKQSHFIFRAKVCVCSYARLYVCTSGNPPSVIEYVHITVCVFALSIWAACVRLSVNLFPVQPVCQSVIFCLLDKEIERMCVCVCSCMCAHKANSFMLHHGDAVSLLLRICMHSVFTSLTCRTDLAVWRTHV